MTAVIQHYLNPLHIYCRLRNIGFAKAQAGVICSIYERMIFNSFIVRRNAECG
jgi:hypothetical protein